MADSKVKDIGLADMGDDKGEDKGLKGEVTGDAKVKDGNLGDGGIDKSCVVGKGEVKGYMKGVLKCSIDDDKGVKDTVQVKEKGEGTKDGLDKGIVGKVEFGGTKDGFDKGIVGKDGIDKGAKGKDKGELKSEAKIKGAEVDDNGQENKADAEIKGLLDSGTQGTYLDKCFLFRCVTIGSGGRRAPNTPAVTPNPDAIYRGYWVPQAKQL
jgi:hypothetical protein